MNDDALYEISDLLCGNLGGRRHATLEDRLEFVSLAFHSGLTRPGEVQPISRVMAAWPILLLHKMSCYLSKCQIPS